MVDRVIQQAISQVLTPIYEEQFSENSYGFRPKRSAHDALKNARQNVNEGYKYVVDMDLEKYFDTVNQSKLIEVLSRTIKDGRVISLIHKYLNAGVISNGMFEETEVGVPQGGPLSPLLSNIMLNELDKELEREGTDLCAMRMICMIFCKSKKECSKNLRKYHAIYRRKTISKSEPRENQSGTCKQSKISWITVSIDTKENAD